MANTASAKKQMRSNERRRLRNRMHIGRARTSVKKAREAIASGDVELAMAAVSDAAKWLDHAASRKSIHKNNAARRKGRLMQQLARLQAQPPPPVVEAAKPAKAAKAAKTEKPPKVEKASKAGKVTKVEKAPKAEKTTKADTAKKTAKTRKTKTKETEEN